MWSCVVAGEGGSLAPLRAVDHRDGERGRQWVARVEGGVELLVILPLFLELVLQRLCRARRSGSDHLTVTCTH